jgi:hypothetical protein
MKGLSGKYIPRIHNSSPYPIKIWALGIFLVKKTGHLPVNQGFFRRRTPPKSGILSDIKYF